MTDSTLSKVWFTPTRGASNWLWLSFFVVILDQATKALVVGAVKFKSSIELPPSGMICPIDLPSALIGAYSVCWHSPDGSLCSHGLLTLPSLSAAWRNS